VTRRVCVKIDQNVAQPIFVKKLHIPCAVIKGAQKFRAACVIKKLPNGRKFAHSGHPDDSGQKLYLFFYMTQSSFVVEVHFCAKNQPCRLLQTNNLEEKDIHS
jgi:hypothetical protein